jgi:hypothetical protein
MTKESLIAYLVNGLKNPPAFGTPLEKGDRKRFGREEREKQIRKLFELKEKFLITK